MRRTRRARWAACPAPLGTWFFGGPNGPGTLARLLVFHTVLALALFGILALYHFGARALTPKVPPREGVSFHPYYTAQYFVASAGVRADFRRAGLLHPAFRRERAERGAGQPADPAGHADAALVSRAGQRRAERVSGHLWRDFWRDRDAGGAFRAALAGPLQIPRRTKTGLPGPGLRSGAGCHRAWPGRCLRAVNACQHSRARLHPLVFFALPGAYPAVTALEAE